MSNFEPRVEIHWIDSGLQVHGWSSLDEVKRAKLSTVETVGYLVHEDDDSLYVALSRDAANSNYYGVQVIAKSNVVKEKRLRWQSN